MLIDCHVSPTTWLSTAADPVAVASRVPARFTGRVSYHNGAALVRDTVTYRNELRPVQDDLEAGVELKLAEEQHSWHRRDAVEVDTHKAEHLKGPGTTAIDFTSLGRIDR